MSRAEAPKSGGRPTAAAAAQLETTILDCATSAFLLDGYAATSIEAIAKEARVAKRTIYARWDNKAALFLAVVRRLMDKWLSMAEDWPETGPLEAALVAAAQNILAVALTPEAIALHRLIITEAGRFPELQSILDQAGVQEGLRRIAHLLTEAVNAGGLRQIDIGFAAEQFLHLVIAGPQRRTLGWRAPLDAKGRVAWAKAAVDLFLFGCLPSKAERSSADNQVSAHNLLSAGVDSNVA